MKLVPLAWAYLWSHRRRTILTTASVALALFLFASLRTVVTTLDNAAKAGSETRLIVRSAIAIVFPLPMSYRDRLAAVPGVVDLSWANWFGGYYQDPQDFFASYAVDPARYFEVYPEIVVPPNQLEAFRRERSAAIVGVDLMRRYGWKLGQDVTLKGTIFPGDWTFTIRGVYTVTNTSFDELSFVFRYDYLDEGTARQISPGWYVLKLSDPALAATVAETIDDTFRNSRQATKTQTERAFQAGFVTMYGNVSLLMNTIGMAVVFAILLVTANAMMMAARERTGEYAVLKAIGFRDGTLFGLVMLEAGAIVSLGATIGLGGAAVLYPAIDFNAAGLLAGFTVTTRTLLLGVGLAALLTFISGLVPALRAARLSVVQALRHVE